MLQKYNKNVFIRYIAILLVLLAGLLVGFVSVPKMEQTIEETIVNEAILPDISDRLDRFKKDLLETSKVENKDIASLFLIPGIKEKFEKEFELVLNQDVKRAYILFKDKDGKLRFLLDVSKTLERRKFWEIFNDDPSTLEKILNTTKKTVLKTEKNGKTYIRYIEPIKVNGEIKGYVLLDLSIRKFYGIISLIRKINIILGAVFTIVISFIAYFFYQSMKYKKELEKMYLDPLTGTYNRHFMYDHMDLLKMDTYTVFVIDIDFFKRINDTYGHEIGDKVLREIAHRIKECLHEEDILIRYGGEEFILFKKSNPDSPTYKYDMVQFARTIKNAVTKRYISVENVKLKVTISIGINLYEYEKSVEEAIKHADMALYKAKQRGRNRIEVYNTNLKFESKNINIVKEAIEEDRVICHYQPIVDLITGRITKYESLVRILTPDKKLLYPGQFLDAIKRTYVNVDLTKKIIEYNAKILDLYKDIQVSINLSAMDIYNEDIIYLLSALFDGSKAERITIEILESEEIEDYDYFKEQVQKIKDLGCKIAIDDFGTGYSNFSHIVELNPDYLKIDGSLIKNIDLDPRSFSIVKAIKLFADDLKIDVVAEFVHNEQVLRKIKSIGIRYGQGFYLKKPIELRIKNEAEMLYEEYEKALMHRED
jgi:diguanylate cyclase (GGDEF)-like protein